MSFHFVQTRVEIALAGSTLPPADGILLPTNDYLWMASGPALDLKRTAGEDVEIAAVRQGPIALGEIVTTDAGALPVGAILHAAMMGQDLHLVPEAVDRAVRKALAIAAGKRWERLLVHSLSASGRRPGPEVARAAVAALVETLLEGSTLKVVTFLAADPTEHGIVHQTLLKTIQQQG